MKVIFLDHQGVMRLDKHPNPGSLVSFDSECVKNLNLLIKETDAEIVVSSDWKYWVDIEEMGNFYLAQGILKKPIDYTPKTSKYIRENYNSERAAEILNWLSNNASVNKWVCIDDLDMSNYLENFVLSDQINGLKKQETIDKLKKFLQE